MDDEERAEAAAAAEEAEERGLEGDYDYEGGERSEEQKKEKEEPKLTGCFVPGAVSYYTAPAVKPAPLPAFNPWGAAAVFEASSSPDDEHEPAMTDVKQSVFPSDSDSLPPAPLDELMRKRREEKIGGERRPKEEVKEETDELPEEKLKRLVKEDPVKPFGAWTVVKSAEPAEKVYVPVGCY